MLFNQDESIYAFLGEIATLRPRRFTFHHGIGGAESPYRGGGQTHDMGRSPLSGRLQAFEALVIHSSYFIMAGWTRRRPGSSLSTPCLLELIYLELYIPPIPSQLYDTFVFMLCQYSDRTPFPSLTHLTAHLSQLSHVNAIPPTLTSLSILPDPQLPESEPEPMPGAVPNWHLADAIEPVLANAFARLPLLATLTLPDNWESDEFKAFCEERGVELRWSYA